MAAEPTLVGLDVGTTGVKAIAISPDGEGARGRVARLPAVDAAGRAGRSRTRPSGGGAAESALAGGVRGHGGGRDRPLRPDARARGARRATDEVIRPAILWNDQRTGAECAEIEERVGLERLIELTGNRALTGFTAPKLLWLRRHEPDAYARIARVMLPKDYVRLRLTGEWAIDASDASGTLLLDVARRDWSAEVLDALELPREWLPPVLESPELAGETTASGTCRTGSPVAAGAGDQPAAALGVGVDRPGALSVVLGTSGVVLAALPGYAHDREARVHAFCHAVPSTWQAMGVMLSAAGSLSGSTTSSRPDAPFDEARRGGRGVAARGRRAAVRAVPRGRAHAVRRPRRARRLRRASSCATTAARSSARCSRASRSGCATRSSCCGSSASTRASARVSGGGARRASGAGSSRRCSACRSSRPRPRRGRRSAPRCSAVSPAGCSPTSHDAVARCVRTDEPTVPDPRWVDAYEAAYAALPRPLPRDEGSHRMTALRLGLLSTANINREILGGAAGTDRVEIAAVGSRDGAKAQAYAAEHGIPTRARLVRGAARGRERRRDLHLAPERHAPRVDDARARRRQARALREAVHARSPRRRRRPSTPPRAPGSC